MTPRRRTSRRSARSLGNVVVLLLLLAAAWLFQRYTSGDLAPAPAAPSPPPAGTTAGTWYELYFTSPQADIGPDPAGGPDEVLVASLATARRSIDVAGYEIDLPRLAEALVAAQSRGVAVRVVTDSDNVDEDAIRQIEAAGIPVLGDQREALMHDKFIVIDQAVVWTGSMNFTVNDAYRNDNHLIRIASGELAQNYRAEFEEMFTRGEFGPTSSADTPFPDIALPDGARLQNFFAPEDDVAPHLVAMIGAAQRSIQFLAFAFTSDEIGEAMLARAAAGVSVQGVFEESQVASSGPSSEYERLRAAGLDVRLDGNPRNMHHKVIVVDGQTVAFGSYNFSRSAQEQNDENLLIVTSPALAARFAEEFARVFGVADR